MKTKQTDLLRLNLQYFSDDDGGAGDSKPPVDPPTPTYTQADIDRIVGERLAREKQKADKAIEEAKAEAERKRLEESNEFKALYEAEKAERERERAEAQAERLATKKQSLLLEAGYTADKLGDLLDFVTGDDEEGVKASVEKLVRVAPPKAPPVDPAVNGGNRQQPDQQDGTELGKAMYERIKNKIR